ncbi:unnamed protein product, partial [marine sediment metagenome]
EPNKMSTGGKIMILKKIQEVFILVNRGVGRNIREAK